MTYIIQPVGLCDSVESLLSASHLPTSDLRDGPGVQLFACMTGDQLSGVVGLEMHGDFALLRSLAVPSARRGDGLGAALVSHVEHHAARQGIDAIYLLTTTASGFFERLGYDHVPRDAAPAAIAGTSQFSGLCPASSAFMAKSIGG